MVAMVVIKCPETDQEIPTGILTDLARFYETKPSTHVQHCRVVG